MLMLRTFSLVSYLENVVVNPKPNRHKIVNCVIFTAYYIACTSKAKFFCCCHCLRAATADCCCLLSFHICSKFFFVFFVNVVAHFSWMFWNFDTPHNGIQSSVCKYWHFIRIPFCIDARGNFELRVEIGLKCGKITLFSLVTGAHCMPLNVSRFFFHVNVPLCGYVYVWHYSSRKRYMIRKYLAFIYYSVGFCAMSDLHDIRTKSAFFYSWICVR